MDVDLSTNLESFLPLVAPILSGHSEVAIGTRLGAQCPRPPAAEARGALARLQPADPRRVPGGFSDAQCGFKAVRADVARQLLPLVEDDGWFFDTELLLLAERNGLRIHEVPVDWIEDLDSRVDLAPTIAGDLAGLWRMRRAFWRGRGRLPVGAATGGGGMSVEAADPRRPRGDVASSRCEAARRRARRRSSRSPRSSTSGRLDQNGYANDVLLRRRPQHAQSWHNFFFVSFDPGGLVVGRQAAARALGRGGEREGLRLLGLSRSCCPRRSPASRRSGCSTCSSRAYFGRVAGLVAALALAVSPVSVAVNRDNNPDALLALLLVAAAYVRRARGRVGPAARRCSLTAVLVGLAFNTKMLAAMVVVPGLALAYAALRARALATRGSCFLALAGSCSSRSPAPGSRPST